MNKLKPLKIKNKFINLNAANVFLQQGYIRPISHSASLLNIMFKLLMLIFAIYYFIPVSISASNALVNNEAVTVNVASFINHPLSYFALGVFILAYILVILEEYTHMRKSKPVLLAAGIIWMCVSLLYKEIGQSHIVEEAAGHNLLEYAELMLFLLVAMTYVNAMEERNVFNALKVWLIHKGFTLRQIFWLTGILAFAISPIADNLTTALIMSAVIIAVGGHSKRFIATGCANIVVAANAGGAFSPFGDITTLMVWQANKVHFSEFFMLFLPSLVNWFVPALFMSFFIPPRNSEEGDTMQGSSKLKRGARGIVLLFLMTIVTAIFFHNYLHLPAVMGMFTGLAYLQFYGYYLKKTYSFMYLASKYDMDVEEVRRNARLGSMVPFDVFRRVAHAEWDTLLFFYGVVLCVGGLGLLGYLAVASEFLYINLGPTVANILVGILSAIVDNIPVMFAVLSMDPDMNLNQWLLVTLTAGVGGSLLSVGSAAGVALMGQSKGLYTFMSHLKWTPVIALGYVASIGVHIIINGI